VPTRKAARAGPTGDRLRREYHQDRDRAASCNIKDGKKSLFALEVAVAAADKIGALVDEPARSPRSKRNLRQARTTSIANRPAWPTYE